MSGRYAVLWQAPGAFGHDTAVTDATVTGVGPMVGTALGCGALVGEADGEGATFPCESPRIDTATTTVVTITRAMTTPAHRGGVGRRPPPCSTSLTTPH